MYTRIFPITFAALAILTSAARPSAAAQPFNDDFQQPLATRWTVVNRSAPTGSTTWQNGPINAFLRTPGNGTDFAAVGYESAGGTAGGTASDWLISPSVELQNGQTLSFDTIGQDGGGFPDRMQVRLNILNASTDVGTTETSVGDFTTLLLDINPGYASFPQPGAYPVAWSHYALPISGLAAPVQGRFAFRYFVEDSGPAGSRGTEIAIDNVLLTSLPEPAAAALALPWGLLGMRRRRRRF